MGPKDAWEGRREKPAGFPGALISQHPTSQEFPFPWGNGAFGVQGPWLSQRPHLSPCLPSRGLHPDPGRTMDGDGPCAGGWSWHYVPDTNLGPSQPHPKAKPRACRGDCRGN